MVIWHIFPVLVFCSKKNLATLVPTLKFWHIFPRFGILYQEKSGNPGSAVETEDVFPLSPSFTLINDMSHLQPFKANDVLLPLLAEMFIHSRIRVT
jgi:hypothetical protein